MTPVLFLLLLLQQSLEQPNPAPEQRPAVAELLTKVEQSGRVVALVRQLDDGIRIAPGAPPLLTFRARGPESGETPSTGSDKDLTFRMLEVGTANRYKDANVALFAPFAGDKAER
jgi:hypothetical protein